MTSALDWDSWAEWRCLVGRARAEVTAEGCRVPASLAALTEERLSEVRGWIETAGLVSREGLLAPDTESMDGVLA